MLPDVLVSCDVPGCIDIVSFVYFSCRALQPPGWLKDWHCGVRVIKSKKLVGFISAVPANIKIYDK